MNTTTIDTGELLDICEKIIPVLKSEFDDYAITDHDDDFVSNISYSTKIKDVLSELDLDVENFTDILMAVEKYFEINVIELDDDGDLMDITPFKSIYDVAVFFAIEIYKNEAEKKNVAEKLKEQALQNATKAVTPTLGVLLVPSLETHGRFLAIHEVSVEEAKILAREFTVRVEENRKTKDYTGSHKVEDIEFYHNIIDFDSMKILSSSNNRDKLENSLQVLKTSDSRGVRGHRMIFVAKGGIIGLGTTVVFNPNWATKNFSDPNMIQILSDIQKQFS